MRHTIARNAADGGYTKKFVACNVAEVGRDSTAQYCTQQILGWIHDAIQPLRAILHRVSGPHRVLTQVAQARYMSSSMWTFALLRDSSDLHIYKDLYGERSKPEKKRKITVELQ